MNKCGIYVCPKEAIFQTYWCLEHAIENMKYNYSRRPGTDIWINYGNDLREAILAYLKEHPEEGLEI